MLSHSSVGALWIALFLAIVAIMISAAGERATFTSHEVTFTDSSPAGMAILPASCSSNPGQYHDDLDFVVTQANGWSFKSDPGETEYGAWGCYGGDGSCDTGGTGTLTYICATNNTSNTYFFPANTAAELSAVKAVGSSINGLQVW